MYATGDGVDQNRTRSAELYSICSEAPFPFGVPCWLQGLQIWIEDAFRTGNPLRALFSGLVWGLRNDDYDGRAEDEWEVW